MKGRKTGPEAAIRLIGLAARAGSAVPGTERVRSAARRGELAFALVAEDASHNTMDKLLPLLRAKGVAYVVRFSRAELGAAVGRAPLGALGVTDASLAGRVRALLADEPEAEA
mgnify:CR=1 FL=1